MLLVIQRKAVSHLCKATMDTPTTSTKMSEWYESDYDKIIDMLALDHEITTFACLSTGYLTVVDSLEILPDLT